MRLNEPPLSDYGRLSRTPSPVCRMMAEFAAGFRDGVDVNLGVGYVNENTIPRRLIVEATEAVLSHPADYDKPLNYGASQGYQPLLDAIRRYILAGRVGSLTAEVLARKEIVVGVSGATSLLEAVATILRRGIVITSDPMYYIYCDFLERLGWEVLAVPEDDEGIRTDLVKRKLAALGDGVIDVRFLYVVTVNNPTATILSDRRRAELVRIATDLSERLGTKVPLILDRAYEELIHDPAVPPPRSGFLYDDAGIVHEIATVSKILAPGLRIGYMIAPPGELLAAIIQHISDVGFSAPPIDQAIAAWLMDHHVASQVALVNAGYRQKALAVGRWIAGHLGGELEHVTGGKAGFYYYLTFRDVQTHDRSPFFRYLSRTTGEPAIDGPPGEPNPRVIYIPGQYCVHPRGDLVAAGRRQLRLSYGFEELSGIERAIAMMKEAAEYARTAGP